MKIVKLTFPPEKWDIAKYSPGGTCIWGDYKFILNQDIDECDYWLVCGNLLHDIESTFVSPENVIFDTSESADIINYNHTFLNKFSYISSFRTDLTHKNLIHSIPIIPWFTKESYDQLSFRKPIAKTKKISLLASDKKISINHIKRLNFIKKIHKYFGNEIDIYGAGFTDHIYDKTPTLEPYEFSIVLETITDAEYFSEKLGDCYLANTIPVYYGCINLFQYFPEKSYLTIDINNLHQSISSIKKILDYDNFHNLHLEFVNEAKSLYINKYSLFAVMANILDKVTENNKQSNTSIKKEVKLEKFYYKKDFRYFKNKIKTIGYEYYTNIFN